jgi:chromosome segregation ATPase
LAVNVMAEGSETPNGEQGLGPPRRGEGDLFAERRARRAAESGEAALTRRAEAAEATLQTLERHVASLQQRLHEAEDEHVRLDELLEAERATGHEREHELRRVKQREYAEQQLRVEAEDRLSHVAAVGVQLERESRAEIEQLSARLSASEDEARERARRLEGLQRQLVEAEQQAVAERAALQRSEHHLQARMDDLERRALEIQQGLDAERGARERSERLLENMREGHSRIELLVGEMKGIVARVSAALAAEQRTPPARQLAETVVEQARGAEMADALAAAVERLRARAETVEDARVTHRPPAAERPAHKHSMSWLRRRGIKRKQRRERRGR